MALHAARFFLLVLPVAMLPGCNRAAPTAALSPTKKPAWEKFAAAAPKIFPARSIRETYAAWYRVPPKSLAHRRASDTELTAAHNRLPLGTLVRVTNLENNKAVTVRITDRGITHPRAKIDLCHEAARQIGMLSEGIIKVRLEILSDAEAASVPITPGSGPPMETSLGR